MIRNVTLNDDRYRLRSPTRLLKLIDKFRLAEIDVLFYHVSKRTHNGNQDFTSYIDESLYMIGIFSYTKHSVETDEKDNFTTIDWLSILSGSNVWMLSSGRFCLPGECPHKNQVAQFAVIRQKGNSALVINTKFPSIASVQLKQLRSVFSHHRLQEKFDAGVLCSNRTIVTSKDEFQSAIITSAYKLANETSETVPRKNKSSQIDISSKNHSTSHSNCGMMFTLIPKNIAPATVKIHGASAKPLLESALNTEVEFNPDLAVKKNLFMFPLSYAEQCS